MWEKKRTVRIDKIDAEKKCERKNKHEWFIEWSLDNWLWLNKMLLERWSQIRGFYTSNGRRNEKCYDKSWINKKCHFQESFIKYSLAF